MPRYHHIEAQSRHWGNPCYNSKKQAPLFEGLVLEAPPRFELGNQAFAELCLTTWLWCHASIGAYVCTLLAYFVVTGARDEIFASGSHCRASLPSTSRKLPLCGQPNSRMSRSTLISVRCSRTSMSLERETRFELATFALARQRSTTEPLSHFVFIRMVRMKRLELPCRGHRILSPARLPIPPHPLVW